MISNKKEFIKKVNALLYSFVWKGNDVDEVKRAVLISPIEKGGLKFFLFIYFIYFYLSQYLYRNVPFS